MLNRMSSILSSFSVFVLFARVKHIIQYEQAKPTPDTTPDKKVKETDQFPTSGDLMAEATERICSSLGVPASLFKDSVKFGTVPGLQPTAEDKHDGDGQQRQSGEAAEEAQGS
jgi:hypothetical protein